ncbi:unnamed protein product [Urochloa decumbens]|uniref:Uncharacterized protein n=1 Tax=Urochloa decumbens TaxID=240449 RepID=A0ABC8W8K4_9POAL
MAAWVARPQHPAASMMARVDRLDLVLGYLEDMMQQQHRHNTSRSTTATSSPSTTPTSTAGGYDSSAASTPRGSKTWRRRPVKEALEEAQAKGTLVDRIAFLEDRVLKMEEDMDIITPEKMTTTSSSLVTNTMSGYSPRHDASGGGGGKRKKQGLKSLVKSCVRGNLKTKD